MNKESSRKNIQLLQFFICENFKQDKQDGYLAKMVRSNLYVPTFPYYFQDLYAITCWQKDGRFHKEVLEYTTEDGSTVRSPHMDIEPLRDSVLFRWHTHHFPSNFPIKKPTTLHVKVLLDGHPIFHSYLLIEKK